MAGGGSVKVVIAGVVANMIVACSKFFAAFYTGSSAMFSEAVHSVVDSGNQALLLYGIKRSEKPADAKHPFGYGGEVYFWAFVVAILIFAIGAGVSFYEGWHKLQHPEPITSIHINYIILAFSFVVEGWAWWVAFKEFNRQKGEETYLKAVRTSKDPRVFTVLFEDSAAMLGLIVAAVGITLSHYFDMPWMDGAASIMIGVILACIAATLAYECKGLLVGEGATPEMVAAIKGELKTLSDTTSVNEVLTVHFGPEDVLVTISLDFNNQMSAGEVETIVTNFEQKLKQKFPVIRRIFIEAQGRKGHAQGMVEAPQESS